jgi:hypothetical protein
MTDKSGDGSASAAGVSFSLKVSATAKRRQQRKPTSGDDDEGAGAAKRHKGEVIAALEEGSAVDAEGLTDEQRAERKRKEAELVIPLPTSKPWAKQQPPQQQPGEEEDGAKRPTKEPAAETTAASRPDGAAPMSLEEEAVAALIKEATAAQAGPRGEGEVEVGDIPLLMKNRIPGMESAGNDEERFRVDVNVRPAEPGEDEYERVPVEAFGAALLRGMGWKKGEAIGGTNKGLIEPVEFVPRAKGLGLGATVNSELRPETHKRRTVKPGDSREAPKQMEARRADGSVKHVRGLSEQLQEVEDLALKRGSFVAIERGPHSGHVGTAQRIYSRGVDVKLGISGVVVTVQEDFLRTVRRADYQELLAELRKHGRRADGSGPTDRGREQRTNTDQERGDAAKQRPHQAVSAPSTSTERRAKVCVEAQQTGATNAEWQAWHEKRDAWRPKGPVT